MDQRKYFEDGSVIWNLQSSAKHDAIREVIYNTPVFRSVQGLDIQGFEDKVFAREELQSTGFGHGVAVAHGRTDEVDGPHIALGVSREGIEFNSVDGKPVHLLFVVATHPAMPMDYLQILSTLVSLVRNEVFRNELLGCACREDVELKLCDAFQGMMTRARDEQRNAGAASEPQSAGSGRRRGFALA